MGWVLVQCDWHPYKEREIWTQAQNIEREDSEEIGRAPCGGWGDVATSSRGWKSKDPSPTGFRGSMADI